MQEGLLLLRAVGGVLTGLQLAEECGYTNSYVSAVLHGKKGDEKTKQTILDGLERLEKKRREEAVAPAI